MADAYITRRGGGAPLNFKVVGGTKPSNPKENTIWVNTDAEITGWQFASDDPNLLDFNNWANNVTVANGSKVVSGNAIHLTSDGNGDCYTMFYGEGTTMIPCTPGKTYVMEWEHSGDAGYVYFFGTSGQMVNTHSSSRKLEYIPGEGETQFTFRFGVYDPNVTATYSNIRITEKERAFKPGSVWIQTGTTSLVAMNALKKNSIQVCPLNAKQYVGGAWVYKTAKSYQGGAWVEFDPNRYIFKQGIGSDSAFIHKPWNKYVSDVTTERIYCNAPATTESDGASGFAGAYDFTNYSKLVFDVLSNNSNFSCGYLNSVLDGPKPTLIGSVTPATGSRKTISIDISAVSGNKYIAFKISSGGAGSVEIYNIYLEP